MAGGPDGTQVDCCMRGSSHVGMGVFDTYRLLADVEDSSCVVHIAEVRALRRIYIAPHDVGIELDSLSCGVGAGRVQHQGGAMVVLPAAQRQERAQLYQHRDEHPTGAS